MSDHKMAIAAAAMRNLENTLPTKAAEFCEHYGLGVEFELPIGLFAAEMIRYGIRLVKTVDRMNGDGGTVLAA